jgi:hypothetical protein
VVLPEQLSCLVSTSHPPPSCAFSQSLPFLILILEQKLCVDMSSSVQFQIVIPDQIATLKIPSPNFFFSTNQVQAKIGRAGKLNHDYNDNGILGLYGIDRSSDGEQTSTA